MAGGPHIEPLQRIRLVAGAGLVEIFLGIGKLGGELCDQLCANFVATRAYGWANCGQQVRGAAGEFSLHRTDGFLRDAGEGATPSRVNCSNRALPSIDEKDGHAIRRLNGE